MRKGNRGKGAVSRKRIPDKVMTRSLFGLRLIALKSNGVCEKDGTPNLTIKAKKTTLRMLAHDGRTSHLLIERQRNWMVMVVGIARDDQGNIDTKHHFIIWRGKRINDLQPEVQPKLDQIRGEFNEKQLIDWGWIGEILPDRGDQDRLTDEQYQDRAEEFLDELIEERHLWDDLPGRLRQALEG